MYYQYTMHILGSLPVEIFSSKSTTYKRIYEINHTFRKICATNIQYTFLAVFQSKLSPPRWRLEMNHTSLKIRVTNTQYIFLAVCQSKLSHPWEWLISGSLKSTTQVWKYILPIHILTVCQSKLSYLQKDVPLTKFFSVY